MVRRAKKAKPRSVVDGSQPTAPGTPARACSIYLRDVASFLGRDKLARYRRVSHHFDTTIQAASRLPRYRFHSLDLYVNDSDDADVRLKGSLFGGDEWVDTAVDCCTELMVKVARLAYFNDDSIFAGLRSQPQA